MFKWGIDLSPLSFVFTRRLKVTEPYATKYMQSFVSFSWNIVSSGKYTFYFIQREITFLHSGENYLRRYISSITAAFTSYNTSSLRSCGSVSKILF